MWWTTLQVKWVEGSLSTMLVCVWDDCTFTLWCWSMDLPFTAWPISDHCPFREASANQEALQGPIPQPTIFLYFLILSSTIIIVALFIAGLLNDVSIIYVNTDIIVNLSGLVFVVFLMWRHEKFIFVCFRLRIPSVYFDISIYVFVGFSETVAKVRMHKNTPCTVFSALNKICCILLWTLSKLCVLLFSILSITQDSLRRTNTLTSFFSINTHVPLL